jgi:hypothetical protein
MQKTFSVLGCVVLFVQGVVVAQAAPPVSQAYPIEISVQVYNAAGIEHGTLTQGEREAQRIFQKAGIAVRWIECPLPDPARGGDQVCKDSPDPRLFAMWIANRATPGAASDHALGFALPLSGRSNHASIVYSKLAEIQKQHVEALDCGHLLAYVIAHELAHLLFRSTLHGSGIMQAGWNREDFKRMGQRDLWFDAEQARMLRDGLEARLSGGGDLLLARAVR